MKKLTCDLCGGTLEINKGGKGATCIECGLTYSMEHLREKLGIGTSENKAEEKKEEKYVPIDEIEIELPDENKEEEVIYSGSWETAEEDITYEGEWEIESDEGGIVSGSWEPYEETNINGTLITEADVSKVPFGPFKFSITNVKGSSFSDNVVVSGKVTEGYVHLNGSVTIDGAYGPSYRITNINRTDRNLYNDAYLECAFKGMSAELTLKGNKKDFKAARMLKANGEVDNYFPMDIYHYWGEPKDYFANLLLLDFCDYDIYKDCILTDENIKADFALCKDGEIKLAIFLFGTGDLSERKVSNILSALEEKGIPAIRFIPNFRNTETYVKSRVKAALK